MGERDGEKERGEGIRTESQRKRKRVGKVKGGRSKQRGKVFV